MTREPPEPDENPEEVREHLEDVDDGCGCTEVWEYLSEERGAGD